MLAVGVLAGTPVLADTEGELAAAKSRLADAQAELYSATAALNEAESRLARTRDQIAGTRASIAQLQDRIRGIRERLAERAREAFVSGAGGTIELLLSSASFAEFSDRLEFLGSIAESDASLIVDRQVAEEELRRRREDLARLSERQAADAAALESQRQVIAARFGEIQDLVGKLTAKLNAERAAQRALNLIGQSPQPGASLERCPVAGPNSFVDSFGWPRSGGRTHQGIDLIAPFGTPVVAAHSGAASHSSSSLGGIQAYVRAGNGDYTFYAHLSSYGASGSVSAGTVIGYVGSTGNAGSTNHLHFEYHPGGGAAINPYQLLLAVC